MKNRKPTKSAAPLIESLENRQLMAGQRVFFENFENGMHGWTCDTYLSTDSRKAWGIASGFAHSGSHSAGTINAGNDAVLASPAINLPSANQYSDHIYLRWWQFADYKSRGGLAASMPVVREWVPELAAWGPWNVIDPNSETTPQQTKTWNNVGLDLTQFQGERVQVGFHHYGYTNGARGWMVDDVEITKEQVQKPWHADTGFENGFDGWTTTRGVWDIGFSNAVRSPSGGKIAGTGLLTSPVAAENSSLVSPAFNLPANPSHKPVTLSFNSFLDRAGAAIITAEFQFYMPSTGWSPVNNLSADLADTVLNIYQPAGRWKTFTLPVTNSFGGANILPFRILFTADVGINGGRGWFIDDVKLNFAGKTQTNPTPMPTAAPEIKVSNPFGELTDGVTRVLWGTYKPGSGAKDITFTVKNAGNATLNIKQLVLDNSIGFSIAKMPAATVAAGGTTTFTLRMSTATVGTKSAMVRLLSNDADEATFNFNISGVVKA
jgi:hypothetical protein